MCLCENGTPRACRSQSKPEDSTGSPGMEAADSRKQQVLSATEKSPQPLKSMFKCFGFSVIFLRDNLIDYDFYFIHIILGFFCLFV